MEEKSKRRIHTQTSVESDTAGLRKFIDEHDTISVLWIFTTEE